MDINSMPGKLLQGARILDLSRMLTGGYGSMLLGDMGAEVIKIEPPDGGDPLRSMPPHFVKGESAYFLSINRSKKSVTLDLRADEGRRVFHALVKRADVVFDNFRPGILEKLGADYETLKKINPGIICCSILSFGRTGPYASQPAFDLTIQALSGVMSYTGEPGRLPVRMGIPMGDLAGSMYAAFSISAALYHREKTGEGRKIELSLLDCLVALHTYVAQYFFSGGEVSGPIGSGHLSVVPYRAFATKDKPLVIAIFVEKFWKVLCDVIGEPEMGRDPRLASAAGRLNNRAEVDERVQKRLYEKTREEWLELLRKAEVPCAPILSIDEVFEDPQVVHDEMKIEIQHPRCGTIPTTGTPVKETPAPAGPFAPPPLLGEHTEEVLTKLAGMTKEEIETLRAKKIV
jgi:crotonobetainyl-CoA:carnitine CoA-transferase CaiB-like acyl-CoA transferase